MPPRSLPIDVTSIPDWRPAENQGAGAAVADLDGDGLPDLVVLMAAGTQARNTGFYRVGRALDATDTVAAVGRTGLRSPATDTRARRVVRALPRACFGGKR